jgi:anti-sigma regulatory factor (Ser/Thr protein kinase)
MTREQTGHATNLSNSAPFVEFAQSLACRTGSISTAVDQLMRFIKLFVGKFGADKGTDDDIEVAIREVLANAVIRANHEDPGKQVSVICRCSVDGEVLITVRDEGLGFDNRAAPYQILSHERGLHLMKTLMDDVSFEENGTVVRMRKRMKNRLG